VQIFDMPYFMGTSSKFKDGMTIYSSVARRLYVILISGLVILNFILLNWSPSYMWCGQPSCQCWTFTVLFCFNVRGRQGTDVRRSDTGVGLEACI